MDTRIDGSVLPVLAAYQNNLVTSKRHLYGDKFAKKGLVFVPSVQNSFNEAV